MSGTRTTHVSNNARAKPLLAALALSGFGLFIAAPTPGNVGGCSGASASRPVAMGNIELPPMEAETPEYAYFDRGLCSHVCTRLMQCRSLCLSLSEQGRSQIRNAQGDVLECNDNTLYDPANIEALRGAFRVCVRERGGLRDFVEQGVQPPNPPEGVVFGLPQCPHACPCGMRENYAPVEWDVQTCGDAVLSLTCDQINGPGTIFGAFTNAPSECLSACKPCR